MNMYDTISDLTPQQIMDKYDVEIQSDGRVYDLLTGGWFQSVEEWANESLDEEDLEYDDSPKFQKMNHKQRFDDERY